ncbi:MAG: cellulase family glycosylhydrolase [Ignavibacteria bacterium]|nr:cellulase family glycosylhydrolase [Ignavibacteria bacterium]
MSSFVKGIRGKIFKDGKEFRFIGANVYELANVDSIITEKIIEDSYNCGFSVLRFWLFENKSLELQIKKLNEICDYAGRKDIKLIVSMADKWGYLQNYSIDENWYREGYKENYISYVKTLCSEFRERNEIMIWELINEPETDSFNTIYEFTKAVSEEIKSVNENHLLSLGTVGGIGDKFGGYLSVFRKKNFRELYSIPAIDVISIHDYSYDSSILERLDVLFRFKGNQKTAAVFERADELVDIIFDKFDNSRLSKGKLTYIPLTLRWLWDKLNEHDINFSAEIRKPLYVGEVGFKSIKGRDRKKLIELDTERKFSVGVSGYILWSFEAQGWSKDGHGYGFGPDDGFCEVVKKWNSKFQNYKHEK